MAQAISKKETTQTAVDWLFEQIQNGNITSEKTDCGYLVMINDDCLNKAKAMEKEQIEWSWVNGKISMMNKENKSSEEYYKENYGTEMPNL